MSVRSLKNGPKTFFRFYHPLPVEEAFWKGGSESGFQTSSPFFHKTPLSQYAGSHLVGIGLPFGQAIQRMLIIANLTHLSCIFYI
jgi:hypothetical protein